MTMIKIIMIIRRRCIVHFKYISTKNNYTGLAFSKNVLKRVPWCLKKSVWKKMQFGRKWQEGIYIFLQEKNANKNWLNTSFNMAFATFLMTFLCPTQHSRIDFQNYSKLCPKKITKLERITIASKLGSFNLLLDTQSHF